MRCAVDAARYMPGFEQACCFFRASHMHRRPDLATRAVIRALFWDVGQDVYRVVPCYTALAALFFCLGLYSADTCS